MYNMKKKGIDMLQGLLIIWPLYILSIVASIVIIYAMRDL